MKSILLSFLIFTSASFAQTKDSLKVGSLAPSIKEANWIKGEHINEFKKGHVYIVEFWATWCGPCRMAMPHLSELANQYKGKVTVMSFNSKERAYFKDKNIDYIPRIKDFVRKLGDGMDYNVALDGPEETLWANWMTAAGFSSIPRAFIIGKDQRIAWAGHPEQMDDVLAAIVEDDYTEARKQQIAVNNKLFAERTMSIWKPLREATEKHDYAAIIAITDTAIGLVKPSQAESLKMTRFRALCHVDKAAARKYGEELIQALHRDPISLYSIGREIVFEDPSPGYLPDYELGLKFLQAAAARSDAFDQPVLTGLAKAYARTGNLNAAVKWQKQALQVIEESKFMKYSDATKEKAAKALEEYEAALKHG